jgi:predicted AAA+ superfamily ATPase
VAEPHFRFALNVFAFQNISGIIYCARDALFWYNRLYKKTGTIMNHELVEYLQRQIRTTDIRLKHFTHNINEEKYPKRFMFVKLEKYIDTFLNKHADNRMIIITGFRGVGKTTLMAQVCSEYKNKIGRRLFLSAEEAKNLFDVGIAELMSAYEYILGEELECLTIPALIVLDEIQIDPKWAVTLKSLFEKTSNVFFCCSGSSALILQTTTDLARRAVIEKMPPISFVEYEMIKNNVYPAKGLEKSIFQAIYFSEDSKAVYDSLLNFQAEVNQYWSKVNRTDVRPYLSYGSLPFAFIMPNETAVYDSISLLLDKIIKIDLPTLGKFDNETLNVVKRILFVLADNDVTSLHALEEKFKVNRSTLTGILDALEKAELLIKVPAYGSNMTAVKKANKYLFMSSAIRMAFFYITGLESTYFTRQGKLLEDSIGAHLYREFILKGQGAMRYDSAKGGADFILQIQNNRQIIIEVGMGDKNLKQIVQSMKKIHSNYNLIFSQAKLRLDPKTRTVFIPLDFYFLM